MATLNLASKKQTPAAKQKSEKPKPKAKAKAKPKGRQRKSSTEIGNLEWPVLGDNIEDSADGSNRPTTLLDDFVNSINFTLEHIENPKKMKLYKPASIGSLSLYF